MSDSDEAAVITGGTRGIGAAIAHALARRGVRLVLNGRGRDPEVDQTLSELGTLTEVEMLAGDAADPATSENLAVVGSIPNSCPCDIPPIPLGSRRLGPPRRSLLDDRLGCGNSRLSGYDRLSDGQGSIAADGAGACA